MYTEQQLIKAYKKGFSNGIGLSNPRDRRYNQGADKLAQDALNAMIPGGLTTPIGVLEINPDWIY